MRLAAAAHWGALAHPDGREQFPAGQPQGARQKVVYSREPQPPAEPRQFRVLPQEQRDEWVWARKAQRASGWLERPQARAAWEQFSELRAKQPEVSSGELLALPV